MDIWVVGFFVTQFLQIKRLHEGFVWVSMIGLIHFKLGKSQDIRGKNLYISYYKRLFVP